MAIKKKSLSSTASTAAPALSSLRKGPGRGAPTAAPAEDEDEDESEGTAQPGAKPKATSKEDAKPNEELVGMFESYDEHVAKAEAAFVELVEFIQEKQLDRNTVVISMMIARSINYETAQTQYSKMKKIFNNEEVLEDLKAGKITMKIARERTKTEQKNPKSAKPEAKEARYTNTLKAFVAAAKESGLARREILIGVEAELKAAQIK